MFESERIRSLWKESDQKDPFWFLLQLMKDKFIIETYLWNLYCFSWENCSNSSMYCRLCSGSTIHSYNYSYKRNEDFMFEQRAIIIFQQHAFPSFIQINFRNDNWIDNLRCKQCEADTTQNTDGLYMFNIFS